VRVDSAIYNGYVIPSQYDSLIAKLIVHDKNRTDAIMKMKRALDEFMIEGVKTTIPLHKKVMDDPDFVSGDFNTTFIEKLNNRSKENV
jgi:acetyl-CoA carboxylase biotin carboxylase subunit